MQTPDDEQFEAYLKRFHPIAPEPVPTLSAPFISALAATGDLAGGSRSHPCYRGGHFANSQ